MTGVWLYAGYFLLSVVSAVFPWVNTEILVLSMSALARTPLALVLVVLVGTAGQMAGKSVLYWTGRGTLHLRLRRITRAAESWHERLKKYRWGPYTLVFLSASVGIPPFYVMTVAAGALKIPFVPFVLLCSAGCILRFSLLVFVPRLVIGLFR
jgi:membrane protein YqaA with SNARE-associated domain